jgi:hypothetical protein
MRQLALFLLLLLSACASSLGPPSNLGNACAMKAERPQWFRAMERTERKWGAPVYVQLATFYQESTFRPDARTPRTYMLGFIPTGRVSSAYGYSQAIDSTWEWYQGDTGQRRAKRDDFDDASDFMGWYMYQTNQRNFVPMEDARNQYLAYHEGQNGFARGTHNQKAWLLRTADRVHERAAMYRDQLQSCR